MRKALYTGLLLLSLSSPTFADDSSRCISNLEKAIIQKNEATFDTEDYGNDYMVQTRKDVDIGSGEKAEFGTTYDKRSGKFLSFYAAVKGDVNGKTVTKEFYVDSGLDGLNPEGRKDEFNAYDKECDCLPRGNQLDHLSAGQIKDLNRQYMDRLKQIEKATR